MTELIIDSFAGGGGASFGIERAIGRGPDVAINHDAAAIAMHAANHPKTKHFTEDVWKVSPHTVTKGRAVGLLWASPDCCHFSRAKGAKPVKKEIRSLAWVVVKWAAEVRPRIIILENVREFEDWGPLVQKIADGVPQVLDDGSPVLVPDPTRKGHSFKRWAGRLRNLGYEVQWRVMNAADYGAPTHRRRLFLIARCDGAPIVWPEPPHGDPKKLNDQPLFGKVLPWRTAAECIDWSIPCPSIFERKKPLAENTLRRIAMGIKRYVLALNTVTKDANCATLITPILVGAGGPMYAAKPASADSPAKTVMAQDHRCLVSAFLAKHFGGVVGHGVDRPASTVTATDHHSLVAANLVHLNHGDKQWNAADEPLRTVTSGNHAALVYAFLVKYFGTAIGANLIEPAPTATGKDRFGLVTVTINGEPYVIVDIGMRMLSPRELARAQGFPDSYVLSGSKSSQVAKIGNSVAPVMAEVLVRANYTPAKAKPKARVS